MLYGPKVLDHMKKPPARLTFEDAPTDFMTVDLEVYSRRRLKPLAEYLSKHLSVHHEGPWGRGLYFAAFGGSGYKGNRPLRTADQQIAELVRLVRAFPPEIAAYWAAAQSRNFDIGVQSGLYPRSYQLGLSPKTLAEAVSVKAKIVVTVYAPNSTYEPQPRK